MAQPDTIQEKPARMAKSEVREVKQSRKRSVRFGISSVDPGTDIQLRQEEKLCLYYNKEELKELYEHQVKLVRRVEARANRRQGCWRGLEHLQGENRGRSDRISSHVSHIVGYQDALFFNDECIALDRLEEALRRESRKMSKADRTEARRLGKLDESDAKQNEITDAEYKILKKNAKDYLAKQIPRKEKYNNVVNKPSRMSKVFRSGLKKLR